jgi:hypothetical protein
LLSPPLQATTRQFCRRTRSLATRHAPPSRTTRYSTSRM